MKTLLTVAALLAGLAGPALADDAATSAPVPQAEPALAPSQEGVIPLIQPQSKAVEAVPMPVAPLESNSAPPSRGGCQHGQQATEVLTN